MLSEFTHDAEKNSTKKMRQMVKRPNIPLEKWTVSSGNKE